MKAHTLETQATITPEKALLFLQEGNQRFVNNLKVNRNLLEQVNETREGQWPFATVLSCIDSRTSAELIFDQGLGDIFSIRIAGNFANQDILVSNIFEMLVRYFSMQRKLRFLLPFLLTTKVNVLWLTLKHCH
mgnify:CR=1 FL=1